MPTVDQLYASLGIEEKKRARMEAAVRRAEREEVGARPSCGKECREFGHYLKGQYAISTSPSGKTYAKCGRCGEGFLLPSVKQS